MSYATLPARSGLAADSGSSVTIGGLTLQSWQLVIWVLAGAVFFGVMIALFAAYFSYKRDQVVIGPEQTYPRYSVAGQRERLMSTLRELEYAKSVLRYQEQQRRSTIQEQFLKSKRAGRRFALAGSSMVAEAGSFLRNPLLGSVRSGVSGVSTPHESDEENRSPWAARNARMDTDSMHLELGNLDSEFGSDSVRSGVSNIETPRGSA